MYYTLFNSLEEFEAWLKDTMPSIDFSKQYMCVIKRYYKKRSVDQNSLYWMWITAISEEIGEERDIVHEALKRKFLDWIKINLPGGLDYYFPSHTPEQNTNEFNTYLSKIQVWASDFLNMYLPFPDDPNFGFFAETYNLKNKGLNV